MFTHNNYHTVDAALCNTLQYPIRFQNQPSTRINTITQHIITYNLQLHPIVKQLLKNYTPKYIF